MNEPEPEMTMLAPAATPVINRVTVVTARGGLRFDADIRGHTVHTDQPSWAGGADTAATPLELLGAALGTCIALYAAQFCNTRGIDGEGIRVEVRSESASAPKRIGSYRVNVTLPDGFPAQYQAAIRRAVETCPVHNTLVMPPTIEVAIDG